MGNIAKFNNSNSNKLSVRIHFSSKLVINSFHPNQNPTVLQPV